MSIGTSANDFAVLIIGGLLLLLIPVVLILIGKLISMILGKRAGGFAFIFMLIVLVGLLFAGSVYIDSAGEPIKGLVTSKQEHIRIRRQGDWRHIFQANVSYRLDGLTVSDQYTSDPNQASAGLNLNAAQYDALQAKQNTDLHLVRIWNSISIIRLAKINTVDLIPWPWIIGVLALGIVGWVISKVVKSTLGCLIILALIMLASIGIPSAIVYKQWQAMENLVAKPLRTQATVSEIKRITRIDPLTCETDCSGEWDTAFDVPQQYHLVQVTFTPQGRQDSIIGVDAADDGTFKGSVGSTVKIAYAANAPREVQLIGAGHSHHWKNLLGFLAFQAGVFLVLLLIALLLAWLSKGRKARLGQVRP